MALSPPSPAPQARLKDLVQRYGVRAWTQVTDGLGTSRTPSGVEQHWQVMNGKRKRKDRGPGVPTATAAVTAVAANPDGTEIVQVMDVQPHQLSSMLSQSHVSTPLPLVPGRPSTLLESHAGCLLCTQHEGSILPVASSVGDPGAPKPKRHRTPGGKTQRWSPEEEDKLKALVHEFGSSGHWPTIAEKLETGRTTAGGLRPDIP